MSRNITYGETLHTRGNLSVNAYPSFCGICHKIVDPIYIGCNLKDKSPAIPNEIQAAFQCTNTACKSIIIGYYERENIRDIYVLKDYAPVKPTEKEFNREISRVSPNFVQIYNQSYYAEQNKLKLISGIGYRKALEFLVKDYLIFLNPKKEQEVLKKPLGQCIDMIENDNIKEISRRAAWIGNDEAHYVRIWEDKDVEDLKRLIEVTVYYISMDVATKKYLQEMS